MLEFIDLASPILWLLRTTGELMLYGLTIGNYDRGRRGFAESFAPVTFGLLFWAGVIGLVSHFL